MVMQMRIRVSLGSAVVLGLARAKMEDKPSTCYLLMAGDCRGDCGFCPQARSSRSDHKWLSRITWPTFAVTDLLRPERAELLRDSFARICIQTVVSPRRADQLQELVRLIRQTPGLGDIPISSSILPESTEEVGRLLAAGVERIGIPLDAANPWIFHQTKNGDYSRVYQLIKEAAMAYPGKISTHVIIGLGETEADAARVLQDFWSAGVRIGLFAFTPVPGTRLAKLPPPPLGQYRRIQVLNYLLATGLPMELTFSPDGRIRDFGYSRSELEGLLSAGTAFRTSGCPGCNRPYYNERPGQTMYNYPRPLTTLEIEKAFAELEL